jgi:hypothetical protein
MLPFDTAPGFVAIVDIVAANALKTTALENLPAARGAAAYHQHLTG